MSNYECCVGLRKAMNNVENEKLKREENFERREGIFIQ
jgi:hypothetical protein